ncbi:MAG: thioredoxin family protein [Pseudomonadota bacterium]
MRHAVLGLIMLLGGAELARADMVLLMLDQPGCEWCEVWEDEIGGAYHLTTEGAEAPLQRVNIFRDLPDGLTLDRRVRFTPTFVLLKDGQEVGRLEGYAGEDFFYPMLNRLLVQARAANP